MDESQSVSTALMGEFAEEPTPADAKEACALEGEARGEQFGRLVDRHARFLYRVAFTLVRNAQDAEDAVQEALLKLYRGDAWQHAVDERAFLARCVWRAGLDRLGSASARALRYAEDVTAIDLTSAAENPEQSATSTQQRDLMRSLIEELPDTLRQALVLSAIEGMRSQEVAVLLGIAEGTVRTRLMRAREELRRRFVQATALPGGPQRGASR